MGPDTTLADRSLPLRSVHMESILDDTERGSQASHILPSVPFGKRSCLWKTSLSVLSQGIPWVIGGEPPPHPTAIWK